jgi:SAM-dependent methyltransferase
MAAAEGLIAAAGMADERGSARIPAMEASVLRPGGLGLTERALAVCGWPAGARVLDVGCGAAATVAYLRAGYALAAFGLDVACAPRADRPRSTTLPGNVVGWIVQADGQHLPLAAAQLDGLLCECTLSLMPAPGEALRGFWRALRPGGWLVLSDVYARPPGGAARGALTQAVLEQMLDQIGFERRLWEDHTPALKGFLGRMIFEQGALPAEWRAAAAPTGATAPRLGYGLWVARRP